MATIFDQILQSTKVSQLAQEQAPVSAMEALARELWSVLETGQKLELLQRTSFAQILQGTHKDSLPASVLEQTMRKNIAQMERALKYSHFCTFEKGLGGHYWIITEGESPEEFSTREDAIVNAFHALHPTQGFWPQPIPPLI